MGVITLADYWMGRDTSFASALTEEIRVNAANTVRLANELLSVFRAATADSERRSVSSGWRPPAINQATRNAAPLSKHMTGQAIDISDPEGDLDDWCLANPSVLEKIGVWQEHPSATKGWCHIQVVPPKSGRRVFYP